MKRRFQRRAIPGISDNRLENHDIDTCERNATDGSERITGLHMAATATHEEGDGGMVMRIMQGEGGWRVIDCDGKSVGPFATRQEAERPKEDVTNMGRGLGCMQQQILAACRDGVVDMRALARHIADRDAGNIRSLRRSISSSFCRAVRTLVRYGLLVRDGRKLSVNSG